MRCRVPGKGGSTVAGFAEEIVAVGGLGTGDLTMQDFPGQKIGPGGHARPVTGPVGWIGPGGGAGQERLKGAGFPTE